MAVECQSMMLRACCESGDSHFAPHGAPRCARAAGNVAGEVLGGVRWVMCNMKPWGGGEGWAVGRGREDGVIVVLGLQGMCAREGARGQKKIIS